MRLASVSGKNSCKILQLKETTFQISDGMGLALSDTVAMKHRKDESKEDVFRMDVTPSPRIKATLWRGIGQTNARQGETCGVRCLAERKLR